MKPDLANMARAVTYEAVYQLSICLGLPPGHHGDRELRRFASEWFAGEAFSTIQNVTAGDTK